MFIAPDRSELDALIDFAEEAARSDWEADFVADMRERFDSNEFWEPTERQIAKLEEIADR
jgi:hypothetical protein